MGHVIETKILQANLVEIIVCFVVPIHPPTYSLANVKTLHENVQIPILRQLLTHITLKPMHFISGLELFLYCLAPLTRKNRSDPREQGTAGISHTWGCRFLESGLHLVASDISTLLATLFMSHAPAVYDLIMHLGTLLTSHSSTLCSLFMRPLLFALREETDKMALEPKDWMLTKRKELCIEDNITSATIGVNGGGSSVSSVSSSNILVGSINNGNASNCSSSTLISDTKHTSSGGEERRGEEGRASSILMNMYTVPY